MRKQRRWMKWIFAEVETFDAILPWERGYKRMNWKTAKSPAAARLIAQR